MTDQTFRILSADDVRRALPMKTAIEAVRKAFILLSAHQAQVPLRTHLNIPEHRGVTLTMPVYIPELQRVGVKFLSLFGDNPAKYGLPTIQALVIVMDATNGRPLALMDGTLLTALRTGAASGVATDILARQDAATAVIFGAGAQGRTQLEAVCAVRPITQAYIFDLQTDAAQRFAREMSARLSIAVDVPTSRNVLREADVICTATTSPEPVFGDDEIAETVHINAVGSYKPNVREVPEETVLRAKVWVDHRESCMDEAGDLLIPIKNGVMTDAHILAEIGEVAASLKPGRTSDSEMTLFKSVGNAVQDLGAASYALEQAIQMNLGTSVSL